MRSIAIDTETTGLFVKKGHKPFAVSVTDDEGNTKYWEWEVDLKTLQPVVPKRDCREIVESVEDRQLILHNAVFDISMLKAIGVEFPNWERRVIDTSIESHIFNNVTHQRLNGNLKKLALNYIDIDDEDEQQLRKAVQSATIIAKNKLKWDLIDRKSDDDEDNLAKRYWLPRAVAKHLNYPDDHPWWSVCKTYATTDTERTILLHLFFWKKIISRGITSLNVLKRECQLIPVLVRMADRGLSLFPEKIKTELARYINEKEDARKRMAKAVGNSEFNPNSNKQLTNVMYRTLRFPVIRRTEVDNPSTDVHALKELMVHKNVTRSPRRLKFITNLKKYRDLKSAVQYLENYTYYAVGNRIYPSLNSTGTVTTRMSSKNPNGQNVSKGKKMDEGDDPPAYNLRAVFGPEKGRMWVCIDYSQLQLRIFSKIADEIEMYRALCNGEDAHGYVASRIFEKPTDEISKLERRIAKNVNFGFVFGASPAKIELTAGRPGLWSVVTKLFPHAHGYMRKTINSVYKDKYVVTPGGYRLHIPYEDGSLKAHVGVNYQVQGCEGELVKQAMINVDSYLMQENIGAFLSFQVHDELIIDFPLKPIEKYRRHLKEIKRRMEAPGRRLGIITPVDIEYTTTTWDKGIKYAI